MLEAIIKPIIMGRALFELVVQADGKSHHLLHSHFRYPLLCCLRFLTKSHDSNVLIINPVTTFIVFAIILLSLITVFQFHIEAIRIRSDF
jgi:hypothetical protein